MDLLKTSKKRRFWNFGPYKCERPCPQANKIAGTVYRFRVFWKRLLILGVVQTVIILILFAAALWYVARLLYRSFTKKAACASGCGKCGVDFSKIGQQLEKKA
jgi:hypothetical protein